MGCSRVGSHLAAGHAQVTPLAACAGVVKCCSSTFVLAHALAVLLPGPVNASAGSWHEHGEKTE